ncbi:MAG: hypothetical protein V3V31_15220 [Methylococcales bacterium]
MIEKYDSKRISLTTVSFLGEPPGKMVYFILSQLLFLESPCVN